MRRSDREVNDIKTIEEILDKSPYMNLSLSKDNVPYVIPLNFSYEFIDDKFVLYFHCAKEGNKINIIENNKNCAISIVGLSELKKDEVACKWSNYYESILSQGIISEVESLSKKDYILKNFMKKHGFTGLPVFAEKMLENTKVYEIECTNLTCKIHKSK